MLVDLEKRRAVLLKQGDRVLATIGSRAFIRREKSLQVLDVDRQAERTLVADLGSRASALVELPLAAIGPYLVDLEGERLLGRLARRPLALTRKGDLLVAEGAPQTSEAIFRGPLRWRRALPIEPRPTAGTAGKRPR
jgi:hypothetical protein